jgi:GntR family transcriptional regulator
MFSKKVLDINIKLVYYKLVRITVQDRRAQGNERCRMFWPIHAVCPAMGDVVNNIIQKNPRTLDRYNPVPLYQQLADILSRQIEQGLLSPGDLLPSENTLIAQYDVSRFVVRQTINTLARQGLIITERGRGSFVSPRRIDKPLDILQSFHAGMRKSGIQVEVEIFNKSIMHPPQEVRNELGLSTTEEVFFLERVAYVNGSPVNILNSYIVIGDRNKEIFLQFPGGSLYEYLQREFEIRLHRSRSCIEVLFAGEYESRLLSLARGAVMIQIAGSVYQKDGKPVEYSRVIYPGATYRFYFDSYMDAYQDDPKRFMST